MNEAHRQSYLRALGLTPWVARVPLPGAAPSEPLDWEAETDHRPTPMVDAVPAAAVPRAADPGPPAAAEPPPPAPEPDAPTADRQTAPEPAAPARPATEALVFTLEAYLAGDTWVVFEQEDPQAPELGRHTGALAASLLAVFGAAPERPWRFYCPLAGQPTGADEARQALNAFLSGLAGRHGGARVLLCLGDALTESLFDAPRYQAFRIGDRPALAVSALQEMLADPARHKRDSWRAMLAEGFGGPRE